MKIWHPETTDEKELNRRLTLREELLKRGNNGKEYRERGLTTIKIAGDKVLFVDDDFTPSQKTIAQN